MEAVQAHLRLAQVLLPASELPSKDTTKRDKTEIAVKVGSVVSSTIQKTN